MEEDLKNLIKSLDKVVTTNENLVNEYRAMRKASEDRKSADDTITQVIDLILSMKDCAERLHNQIEELGIRPVVGTPDSEIIMEILCKLRYCVQEE